MLLVDDDEPDLGERGEERGAGADHHARGALAHEVPLVEALAGGERLCSTATSSPKRLRKRPTVWAVREISGTSTRAPRPSASARSMAAR